MNNKCKENLSDWRIEKIFLCNIWSYKKSSDKSRWIESLQDTNKNNERQIYEKITIWKFILI